MNKTTKGYLMTAAVALIAVGVAQRVPQLKSILYGS